MTSGTWRWPTKSNEQKRYEDIGPAIRGVGLRVTASRVATYAVVCASAGPLSHADVVSLLSKRGLNRATVYRNLTDLTDAGLLTRTLIGKAWTYQVAEAHEDSRAYFVCNECGDVSSLTVVAVQVASGGRVPRAVAANAYVVQLSGRCDGCE